MCTRHPSYPPLQYVRLPYPSRHMAAIWMNSSIDSEPFMVELCALRPITTGFERPDIGRINAVLNFPVCKRREKIWKRCQKWEKMMSRVDEWWLLALILWLYVNPYVIFYYINTEVSHLEWYMVCSIWIFAPIRTLKNTGYKILTSRHAHAEYHYRTKTK